MRFSGLMLVVELSKGIDAGVDIAGVEAEIRVDGKDDADNTDVEPAVWDTI